MLDYTFSIAQDLRQSRAILAAFDLLLVLWIVACPEDRPEESPATTEHLAVAHLAMGHPLLTTPQIQHLL